MRYFGEDWDITNGDEDMTKCENDEYEVRTLLRWRLCRVFRKIEFHFWANDLGVVPSEATGTQTDTTAKKKDHPPYFLPIESGLHSFEKPVLT